MGFLSKALEQAEIENIDLKMQINNLTKENLLLKDRIKHLESLTTSDELINNFSKQVKSLFEKKDETSHL